MRSPREVGGAANRSTCRREKDSGQVDRAQVSLKSSVSLNWALEYHTLILFFLKGTIMKYKFILFSPWLLQSLVKAYGSFRK